MTGYTVKQLAKLSGVSVRTLHHYDEIGLLKPAQRTEAGYRLYGRNELLRLQQILFYRELDIPLEKIREALDEPDFDLVASLEFHRGELLKRSQRLEQLLSTIDKTIVELKNKTHMLTDEELYKGFPLGQGEAFRNEAAQRWGDIVRQSEERVRKMSREQWNAVRNEGETIAQELAAVAEKDAAAPEVQALIARHHRHLGNFYEVTEERYRCLAQVYTDDERFRAYYEKHRPGLAGFIRKAIDHYCDNGMKA